MLRTVQASAPVLMAGNGAGIVGLARSGGLQVDRPLFSRRRSRPARNQRQRHQQNDRPGSAGSPVSQCVARRHRHNRRQADGGVRCGRTTATEMAGETRW